MSSNFTKNIIYMVDENQSLVIKKNNNKNQNGREKGVSTTSYEFNLRI